MRSRVLKPALIVVVAIVVLVAAAPASAAKKGPAAGVRVLACSTGKTPPQRFVTVRAAMRRVPGTKRMWMRFQLEERVGRRRFRVVKAPGLGAWKKSRPGVRRLAVTQRVLELGEGASYRAVVKFRWYDGDRKLIRATRKRSRVCRQPGLLPNLRVRSVSGTRIAPDTVRYAVQVVNRGRAPAVNVGVRLTVDGDLLGSRVVSSLPPGATRKVFLAGPVCSSGVRVDVDPANTVHESDELDNARLLACPSRR